VTERRSLQASRDAQRAYYEFILDMLPVGLGVKKDVDSKPTVEFENKKLMEMFGGDSGVGGHWWERPDKETVPARATIDDTGVYAEERYYPNGRIYQFTLSYYRNLEGSWSELQLVRDVTERRKLEDQVQRAKEDLEKKVEERTRELRDNQAQLVQSEKMAALGQLVAGVAHEVNTPLGALKSNNDLAIRSRAKIKAAIDDPALPAELREHPHLGKLLTNLEKLDEINQTALDRIVAIVKSLRNFARLDKAEQDKVNIHDGIDSTLTLVHHELKNRIAVHKEFSDLPELYCFPNQLNQVFMNVLVNASHAIHDKGDIFIKTYRRDNDAVIEFRDTGKGILDEHLKRIFDPGFTTKGAGVGTGLGLSIVYKIIEDHEGTIEIDSAVDKGTTVRITLPIR
jgi:signal transduction histidine kinase